MAENRVEIVVTSRNDTKAGFDSAKADAERAGDDAGKSFMGKFGSWLTGGQTQASGGIGGIFSTAFSAGPVGIGAIAAAAGALLVELDGLASGFAAASAGAGAFYLLGHNTIQQLTQDYGALQTAQEAVQKAQDKYNLDPTKQNLKALQTAQLNLQTVQQGAQQDLGSAAPAVDKFATALGNLQQKFQPVLFEVLSDAFNAMTQFLPKLIPLANAFADAIGPLFVQLGQFAQSKGFQQWFQQFLQYVGPSTQAIGTGLGQVAISFGKLLTVLPAPDVVRAISYAFDAVNASLLILAGTVKVIMGPLSALASLVTFLSGSTGNTATLGAPGVTSLLGKNFSGLGSLPNNPGVLPVLVPAPYTGAGTSKLRHLAGGGPGSGPTVVNEFGQEVIDLPSGSWVHPAGSSGRGGGGTQVVFSGAGAAQFGQLVKALWPDLQLEVRNRGGGGKNSVQVALGQTH